MTIRISWQYWHYTNSKSRTKRTKKGYFIKKAKPKQFIEMAIVKFEGNKGISKVPYNDLVFIGKS